MSFWLNNLSCYKNWINTLIWIIFQAIPTSANEVSLAVHFTNSTEVGGQTYLGKLSNLSNVIGHDNPDIDFQLIGNSDQGFVMNMGEVLR